jgi:phosphoserine phosphatase RsbU/P
VKLLVAEDDAFFRRILYQLLAEDYQLQVVEDGESAWQALQKDNAPRLAILDWVMPGLTGPQICRRVRSNVNTASDYLILLTAKNSTADIVSGLRAGSDDYVTKPFDPQELRARVRVGQRIIELQSALASQVTELQDALTRERLLQQLLPICPHCRKLRTDGQYWHDLDDYLSLHIPLQQVKDACPHCSPVDRGLLLEPGKEVPKALS